MAVSREEIIEALKEMSLLEASELVKDIEETFGVSAAAPVAVLPLLRLLALLPLRRSPSSTSCSRASATTRSLSSRLSVRSPARA